MRLFEGLAVVGFETVRVGHGGLATPATGERDCVAAGAALQGRAQPRGRLGPAQGSDPAEHSDGALQDMTAVTAPKTSTRLKPPFATKFVDERETLPGK